MTTDCQNQVKWETISCPLCGSDNEKALLEKVIEPEQLKCRMAQCNECAMVYLNPRPTQETIGHFYPENYEAYRSPRLGGNFRKRFRDWMTGMIQTELHGYPGAKSNFARKLLARFASPLFAPDRASHTSIPFHGQGKLLDVGCGGGWFIHRMQQRGWDVTGIDFSAHAVEMTRKNYQLPAHIGTLPHPKIQPESFDVVNLGAVLEHVHDPLTTIQSAKDVLRPGGWLVVSVPNLDSWGFRQFGEDWHPLCLPHHLLHFTPTTLKRLIQAQGMEVRELRIVGRSSWMRRSIRNREQRLGTNFWRRLQRTGRLIPSLMTSYSIQRGQGDCLFMIAERPRFKTDIARKMVSQMRSGIGSRPRGAMRSRA